MFALLFIVRIMFQIFEFKKYLKIRKKEITEFKIKLLL